MPTGATDVGFDVVANQPNAELNYRVLVDTSGTEASLASINAIQQVGGGGRLAFSTDAADGPLAQRMLIDNQGNVGIGTENPGARLDVAGNAKFNGPLNVQGALTASGLKVSGVGQIGGDLSVTGKLTAASFTGDGAGLSTVTPADGSVSKAKLAQALTDQLAALEDGQKRLSRELDRLNSRIDMINANGKIIDLKVAFGADGGGGALVFTNRQDYKDSPIKTSHTGVISGDVIFMIAMVHGYSTDGGPGVARGRIIRTSSGGFDAFGTEETGFPASGFTGGVVTFAGDPRFGGQDVTGGGTLMIAATADASGTYDCRVQIAQRVPGFGAMQLQHMMSLVFRPPT